eukprot:COSAG01_NODE_771_length_13718_cov_54.441442_15_plen_113_part_00
MGGGPLGSDWWAAEGPRGCGDVPSMGGYAAAYRVYWWDLRTVSLGAFLLGGSCGPRVLGRGCCRPWPALRMMGAAAAGRRARPRVMIRHSLVRARTRYMLQLYGRLESSYQI